ncbi:MAG: GTPase HflX [Candidatus Heimdallarchaeota archaeon]|nr:GTPase HflX [Candidatus Heimdallarchaeota archaeon]MCK5048501.1 GTPase HflX [Candidatus Heimdallarchaeota archaeon]
MDFSPQFTFTDTKRSILAYLRTDDPISLSEIQEMREIASALNFEIIAEISQPLEHPHPGHYFGKGKILEMADLAEAVEADTLIVVADFKPSQFINLEDMTKLNVYDRVSLLLELFEIRSQSKETSLQVQAAKWKYWLPRARRDVGITLRSEHTGFRGSGQQKQEEFEIMAKRHIHRINKELESIRLVRLRASQSRGGIWRPTVAILGYYSAGKTTLFNRVTSLTRETGQEPFTTMMAKISNTKLANYNLYVTDTIGLTRVPPYIIEAFQSSYFPIVNASCYLVCLDATKSSEKLLYEAQSVIESISTIKKFIQGQKDRFSDFDIGDKCIIVLTKLDLISEAVVKRHVEFLSPHYELISAYSPELDPFSLTSELIVSSISSSIDTLFEKYAKRFVFKVKDLSLRSWLFDNTRIINEEWTDEDDATVLIIQADLFEEQYGEIASFEHSGRVILSKHPVNYPKTEESDETEELINFNDYY